MSLRLLVKGCFLYYAVAMTIKDETLTDIAQRLNRDYIQTHPQKKNLPAGIFITDEESIAQPEKVIATMPAGFAVIFRDYDHPKRRELGEFLRPLCAGRGIIFLVAGDVGLAENLDADGLHLPEYMMKQADNIKAVHSHWMMTTSCHSKDAILRAATLAIDGALVSPLFPTHSHPESLTGEMATFDLGELSHIISQTSLPIYGLGGINTQTACKLYGLGLAGIAAIRGFS